MRPAPGWPGFAARLALATSAMILVLLVVGPTAQAWLDASLLWRCASMALCVTMGAGVYFAILALTGYTPRRLLRMFSVS